MIFNLRSKNYFWSMVFCALALLIPCVSPARAQGAFNVLTRNYNNQRTGANTSEAILNQSNVNPAQFGKLFMLPVDDQIYAGVLYASDVPIAGAKHNVIFVATVNNSVYAFDADTLGNPLWFRNYNGAGRPTRNTEVGQSCRNYQDFIGNIGIVGTPVIDGGKRTIYFVTRTVEGDATVQRLRAVDITSGEERANSPQVIEASVPGSGEGSVDGIVAFNPVTANQRSALAFSNGVVYVAWASFCDTRPYHGWMISFDAASLRQLAKLNTTPNGQMGGIWMSGAGTVLDSRGNLFFGTGNGSYDGVTEFGETLMKRAPRSLGLVDFFAPSNFNTLNEFDLDFGSQGPMILPGTNLLVVGGKEGKMYVLDANHLGHEVTGDIQIPQAIQATDSTIRPSMSHHMHNANAAWKSPRGVNVYVWGENDYLRAYRLNSRARKLNLPPFATAAILPPMGMPGGMLAISARGSQPGTGIIWATIPRAGDANQATVPGIFYAYNAETLALLWSSIAPGDDALNFSKGSPPIVANGKVYVPSISNFVSVYSLKGAPPVRQNLAENHPATGSAPCAPSQTPEKAFNGSASQGPDDKWCSAAENPFLQVDLGSAVSINRFVIVHAGAGGDDLLWNTRAFNIQVSSDGTNFDTVENVAGNVQSITTHDIAPTTARYVRLNIIVPTQISLNTANIFEFQVFSVPATAGTGIGETTKAAAQVMRPVENSAMPMGASVGPSKAAKPSIATGTERAEPKPGAKSLIPPPADVNALPTDAQMTESGVAMKVLKPGRGTEHPTENDCPILAFTAWNRDGTLFATSKSMGDGAVQCLSTAIMGVAETVKLMVAGEKRRIWVPAELTYVEGHHHTQKRPEDENPPNLDLTFDLELVGIMKAPARPVDLIAPPDDAIKNPSGIAYKILEPGTGSEHPSMKSYAKLNFSGWTSSGKLVETTVTSGHPALVYVGTAPAGWREILPLMVVGGKVRVWIPSELAYGERPLNKYHPAGNLVYELEVLEVR